MNAASLSVDQAHVRAVVVAMTALVDHRDWERLNGIFAKRLDLDYTSLWGGAVMKLTRSELIAQWRKMLPGFDATAHILSDVAVEVDGDRAQASAEVTGVHLLDGQSWVAMGHYDITLARMDGGWRINALRYQHDAETGDRGLADKAKARAA